MVLPLLVVSRYRYYRVTLFLPGCGAATYACRLACMLRRFVVATPYHGGCCNWYRGIFTPWAVACWTDARRRTGRGGLLSLTTRYMVTFAADVHSTFPATCWALRAVLLPPAAYMLPYRFASFLH